MLSLTFVLWDVSDIAKPDSVLLMWVCDPLLDQAFKVIDAQKGFKYKTVGFTWAKTNKNTLGFFTGLGYWTRGNPEMCLLATKGRPKRLNKDVCQLIISQRKRHSEKPLIHGDIERLARVRTLNYLQDKNQDLVGIIGETRCSLTIAILYSIIPLLLVCLLLWMWNGEDPR